jgi:hypothetical protein
VRRNQSNPQRSVIDTNVLVVANGSSDQANSSCVIACIEGLRRVRDEELVALDEAGEILGEYSSHCDFAGQPGVGDEFFRWVSDNRYSCHLIRSNPHAERVYEEFPANEDLKNFDRSDRKFVVTALGCTPAALILNAVDSDWSQSAAALSNAGVQVRELCLDCIVKK